jgi:hypothetical protein
MQALRETGATGLEPATSGVTDRHGATGYDRVGFKNPLRGLAGCFGWWLDTFAFP